MTMHRRTTAMIVLAVVAMIGAQVGPRLRAEEGAPAQSAVVLGSGSTLWLEGKSTLHDYESRTSTLSFALHCDPQATPPTDVAALESLIRKSMVSGLELGVPIEPMRSEKSGLDKNLQKALKAKTFPIIRFALGHYTVVPGAAGDTLAVEAEGTLSVAGHDRAITMAAKMWPGEHGVWLAGTQPLRMSEYDVHPPTMMLGAIKVDDRIVVHYRLLLVPAGAQGAAAATPVERTH